MRTTSFIRYLLIVTLVAILAAFGAWYFFIRAKEAEIRTGDAGRGADLPAQSLGSRFGSTYENIVSTLSSAITGGESSNTQEVPRLAQVNKSLTAGAGFVGSGTSTSLRFVERGTGFIFDVDPETAMLTRLTNTLVSNVYEALVAENGRVLMRGVGDNGRVMTIAASVAGTSTPEGIRVLMQKRLPDGIRSIAVDPGGAGVFYSTDGPNGAVGIRVAWDGTGQQQIFSSAVSGWQALWLSDGRIIVTQNPSDGIPGYSYEIRKDNPLLQLMRGVSGLTFLPRPFSGAILYGASSGGLTLFARASATSTDASLPIRTTAEKCVWAPGSLPIAYCAVPQSAPPLGFLDRYHRGEAHSTDAWWRVDAGAASAELLYSPGNVQLDVEWPIIDKNGDYIAFINAADKTLWLLRVQE